MRPSCPYTRQGGLGGSYRDGTGTPIHTHRLPQGKGLKNIFREVRPLQETPPGGQTNYNHFTDSGDTRQAFGRVGDSSGSAGNPHREIGQTVRDAGGTYEGTASGGNTGEEPCHMTVGESGKYNASGVPRGPPPRGYFLDDNGNATKRRGIFQRYWVGGGDMECVHFHDLQLPLLRHHDT